MIFSKRFLVALSLLLLSSSLILAADEDGLWEKAKHGNDVSDYDRLITEFPGSKHEKAAKTAAAELSRKEIESAAGYCKSLYPRMLYYTLDAPGGPAIGPETVKDTLAEARNCRYERTLPRS